MKSPGERLSHYKIISAIGSGGMGVVYLAEDTTLERRVALKILPPEFAADKDRMSRFVREAKSASSLNHPNIITIYEIGETDGTHFIAAEYVAGETVHLRFKRLQPELQTTLDIAIQVASALDAAHRAGIIHRDIKPDNVMIRPDGLVKLLDFGIAKLLEQELPPVDHEAVTTIKPDGTSPGKVIGTANYMSPEQARGLPVDARSDIWSLGVVVYEILTGQKPFEGETVNHTIVNILEKTPTLVSAFLKDCPAELDGIIQKTLAKNADERYGAATGLLADLKKLQKRLEFEAELAHVSQPGAADAETRIFESAASMRALLPPNNLTEDLPRLIGREKEIAEITNLLRQDNVRLLTMTGIGGTGKTRLAQTVAQRMLPEFTDGVFFVNLAAITDPKLVASTIAQTLGVKEAGGEPILEVLKNHLGAKSVLLVVDNFEQVITAAADISDLLSAGENLKILITSRELLHLKAETGYAVPPLAVPSKETRISFAELANYEAVRFFVERARVAQTDFVLTDENADAVAEICRRLDGLPLAIELAAARVKLFSPAAILTRLSDSLKLLTGGAQDLPERRQTMRGAIAWSYDLLNDGERKLLNRLAVFAGGFTLDAAETIALNSSVQSSDSGIDIFDGVSSLLDKSLILRRDQTDGEPRFRMLVVVREFALEKLAENDEADEIKRLHANFYNAFSEKAKLELNGVKAAEWYEKLEQEHDNIRAALRWALDIEPQTALRFTLSNYSFWARHGYLAEGCQWMTEALEKSGKDADPKLRAEVYRKVAYLFQRHGDIEAAELFGEEGLRLSRQIGDKEMISFSLGVLCVIKNVVGDFKSARTLAEESLAIAREINNKMQIGNMLNSLGEIARGEEDYQAARKYYEDALVINEQQSNNYSHYYIANLACIAYLLGDYQASRSYSLEVLKLNEELGDKINVAEAIDALAAVAVKDEKLEKAARLSGAAAAIYESIGHKPGKVDQDFNDRYTDEVRAAIGDEAFEAAHAKGRSMQIKEAIALAREGESAYNLVATTHITGGSRSHATIDQTAADATEEPQGETSSIAGISSAEYIAVEVKKHRLAWLGGLAVFTVALVSIGYLTYFRSPAINSIAVLPFVSAGDAGDGDLLSDGISENLINVLSRLPQLKVIARTSSFKYRGENVDIQEAAQKLGVGAILTGRLTRRGDDLQINVELINAADNTRIWGDIYNRKVSSQSDVVKEIAQAISETLSLRLSGEQKREMAKRPTNNPQAYQLYLNGVFYRRKNGAENLRKGVEYQNQAIALDANFALAYVELAIDYSVLTEIGALSPREGNPQEKAAAEKALALDATLADAHYIVARIKAHDFDWAGAEAEFRRAIELNPNLAAAHTIYSEYLSQVGRFDEALREVRLAQGLDPLRVGLIGNEGDILYYAHRFDEAITKMQEGLKPEPENAPARIFLGQAYVAAGQCENAAREFQTALQTDNETTGALLQLGRTYALCGKRDEAAAILNELKATKKYVSPAALAGFYAAFGDRQAAFKSLDQAFAEREPQLQFVKVEPAYDSLREDPRFKDLLKRMNLPE
ncbi:MAG: protein kinase domain-containing protein [Pyrinomonadaceae bacterium]